MRSNLKIPNIKRAGGVAQGIVPEFKPWHCKKKKERKEKKQILLASILKLSFRSAIINKHSLF
jgi:hypothetical protein